MSPSNTYSYKQQLLSDLQELLQIPSVQGVPAPGAPYGVETRRALDFMLRRGAELGFKTRDIDGHAGHVEYGEWGPLIGILVHLDVVPAGDAWRHEPFGGTFEDGCVYGRGASDDKGPAVAALYSLRAFADAVPEPTVRIRVIFGLNEESGMAGVKHYFKHEPVPDYGFSPDAAYPLLNRESGIAHVFLRAGRDRKEESEATPRLVRSLEGGLAFNMVPARAEARIDPRYAEQLRHYLAEHYPHARAEPRVRLQEGTGDDGDGPELVISAQGVSAHGGSPANGVNAIDHLLFTLKDAADRLEANNADRGGNAAMGGHAAAEDSAAVDSRLFDPKLRWILEKLVFDTRGARVGIACRDAESGELSVNLGLMKVSSQEIEIGLDIRYPVTWEWQQLRKVLERQAGEAGFTVTEKQHLAPLYVPESSALVQALLRAYRRVTGENAQAQAMPGGTYARMLENRGVAFGANFPGQDTRGHRPDEFIKLESLMKHAEIQTQALFELAAL